MMDDRAHPLLQQTPLTVNPFIDLPKPPTLPHNYASLPSTLPPSALQSPATSSAPNLPAYIASPQGDFAAHPRTLLDQSRQLLEQLQRQREDGRKQVEEWEGAMRETELREKRRKAPGWLDSEVRVLEPERRDEMGKDKGAEAQNLMDKEIEAVRERKADDLGDAMDRAFGSGLGS